MLAIARLIRAVTGLVVLVIVVAIVLFVVSANGHNAIGRFYQSTQKLRRNSSGASLPVTVRR